jgi:hypothetical protein
VEKNHQYSLVAAEEKYQSRAVVEENHQPALISAMEKNQPSLIAAEKENECSLFQVGPVVVADP